jgi:phosphopantetheinyl transferase
LPIRLVRGLLGRPQLLLGEYPGPAVSFSESGGKVWAALCGDGADIGIDVAGTDEFQGEYPLHRVFLPAELDHASKLAGGDLAAAAALLWSIKEAAVKALGCAFHLLEPRQITVFPAAGVTVEGDGGYTFAVGLSGKARERFPLAASQALRVRSFPQHQVWLSIAHRQQRPPAHE